MHVHVYICTCVCVFDIAKSENWNLSHNERAGVVNAFRVHKELNSSVSRARGVNAFWVHKELNSSVSRARGVNAFKGTQRVK